MKKEDIFEKALRQALQKRNGQQPVLSSDFARQVKARMERRNRRLTLGRWAAVVGVAASLALIFVLNTGRGHQASGVGEPLAETKSVVQSVAEVPAVMPDSAVAPSLTAAPLPKVQKAVKQKPKPKEPELPEVPEMTPEQLKQMQAGGAGSLRAGNAGQGAGSGECPAGICKGTGAEGRAAAEG